MDYASRDDGAIMPFPFFNTMKAFLFLGAATATFITFWLGLYFIPRILLYGCFVAIAFGLWKFIDGTTGYLMAARKTSSVADDIHNPSLSQRTQKSLPLRETGFLKRDNNLS